VVCGTYVASFALLIVIAAPVVILRTPTDIFPDIYSPQFPLRLLSKDMDLILETARAVGAELPAACVAKSVLDANVEVNGDLDLSAATPFVIHHANDQSEPRQRADIDSVCI
jgi:hypothetical protein